MDRNENATCEEYDSILAEGFVDFFRRENVKNIVVVGPGMGKYIDKFQTNDIHTVVFENSIEWNQPTEWAITFLGNVSPEDSFLANIHTHTTHGIVLSCERNDGWTEQEFRSKIRDLGYIHDIDVEQNMRNMSTVSSLKNTLMVFRKVYNYNQGGYSLCLVYNKPVHLNDNIRGLPNTYGIADYKERYRRYFHTCTNQDFMIDIGANMGLSACPILAMGEQSCML